MSDSSLESLSKAVNDCRCVNDYNHKVLGSSLMASMVFDKNRFIVDYEYYITNTNGIAAMCDLNMRVYEVSSFSSIPFNVLFSKDFSYRDNTEYCDFLYSIACTTVLYRLYDVFKMDLRTLDASTDFSKFIKTSADNFFNENTDASLTSICNLYRVSEFDGSIETNSKCVVGVSAYEDNTVACLIFGLNNIQLILKDGEKLYSHCISIKEFVGYKNINLIVGSIVEFLLTYNQIIPYTTKFCSRLPDSFDCISKIKNSYDIYKICKEMYL